jgi:hypothetical protein
MVGKVDAKVRGLRRVDPSGKQPTKTFDRKLDAERFLTTVEGAELTGTYIDPQAVQFTVGLWVQRWLDGQTHLKPTTRERYAGILLEHVVPRWGSTRLPDVTHSAMQAWVSDLAAAGSAATVRKVHRVLSESERRYLMHAQVQAFAAECRPSLPGGWCSKCSARSRRP